VRGSGAAAARKPSPPPNVKYAQPLSGKRDVSLTEASIAAIGPCVRPPLLIDAFSIARRISSTNTVPFGHSAVCMNAR
jgi:hypothetical protein